MDILDELKWRGLFSQSTDEKLLSSLLSVGSVAYYCGFDPTAPSLHHGNLVQLILMRHLQNAGHRPICLIGGATGLIGDPKLTGERTLNDAQTVHQWSKRLAAQLKHFLRTDGPNGVIIENNYSWLPKLSALDFLRDVGKHFRLGTMLAKDTVASRLSGSGLSFTEFSYQILQAYDFNMLHDKYGAMLQTGGQDQWGNLTSGLDYIHKMSGDKVHVLTTPLITKVDGTKFGKSEGGAIWLDSNMMGIYEFYQFWLNVADEEVVKLLKVFTFSSVEEISALEEQVQQAPEKRDAQRKLAEEVTKFVHGEKAFVQAVEASDALFGRGSIEKIDEATILTAISGLETSEANLGDKISEQFVNTKLSASFNDYRKTLSAGGVYVNNKKVESLDRAIENTDILNGQVVLLRKGKKNIAAVRIT
ncbi:MAG: tyrosine--tRNA ligase [Candidatus Ancillula trichonymphae]|nr:tyrosine--tRNA ligase [Candidatus Ancillula trichonymphae]